MQHVDRRQEDGFSLVELFVVMLIVGILALIAIPALWVQRDRAYAAAVESDLANAAIEMESARAEGDDYSPASLAGFRESPAVTVSVERGGQTFCLEGRHANVPGATWAWDSAAGGLQGRGSC